MTRGCERDNARGKITYQEGAGRAFRTFAPDDPSLIGNLREKGVRISALPAEEEVPSLFGILLSWLPMIIILGVWIFFMRQMQGGGGKAMGFGKSRARMLTEHSGRVTFEDVAGIDEAKQELEELSNTKDQASFSGSEARYPKVTVVGASWTGKTLLARVCWRTNVPFFTIWALTVEMFVGVGGRVRDMVVEIKCWSSSLLTNRRGVGPRTRT